MHNELLSYLDSDTESKVCCECFLPVLIRREGGVTQQPDGLWKWIPSLTQLWRRWHTASVSELDSSYLFSLKVFTTICEHEP